MDSYVFARVCKKGPRDTNSCTYTNAEQEHRQCMAHKFIACKTKKNDCHTQRGR